MVVSKPIRRLAASVLVIIGFAHMSHLAHAQDKPDNFLQRLFQPPASGSVPAPGGGGTGDWSGQPGAEAGHGKNRLAYGLHAAPFDVGGFAVREDLAGMQSAFLPKCLFK